MLPQSWQCDSRCGYHNYATPQFVVGSLVSDVAHNDETSVRCRAR